MDDGNSLALVSDDSSNLSSNVPLNESLNESLEDTMNGCLNAYLDDSLDDYLESSQEIIYADDNVNPEDIYSEDINPDDDAGDDTGDDNEDPVLKNTSLEIISQDDWKIYGNENYYVRLLDDDNNPIAI